MNCLYRLDDKGSWKAAILSINAYAADLMCCACDPLRIRSGGSPVWGPSPVFHIAPVSFKKTFGPGADIL